MMYKRGSARTASSTSGIQWNKLINFIDSLKPRELVAWTLVLALIIFDTFVMLNKTLSDVTAGASKRDVHTAAQHTTNSITDGSIGSMIPRQRVYPARGESMTWIGGEKPSTEKAGSCWCSVDEYCLCTPSLRVDVVLQSGPNHVYLVKRGDTEQFSTTGGFVQMGESAMEAVKRELKEEMGMQLSMDALALLGFYSDPMRDNRRHSVSAVFVLDVPEGQTPKAGDDVKEVSRVALSEVEKLDLFGDHRAVMIDFKRWLHAKGQWNEPIVEADRERSIARTTCVPPSVDL